MGCFRFFICVLLLSITSEANAQEIMQDNGKPGSQSFRIGYRDTLGVFHQTEVDSEEAGKRTERQTALTLFAPVYQNESSTWALTGLASRLSLNAQGAAGAPSNFTPPEQLSNYQAGGAWTYQAQDEAVWGANLSVGSASDKPFEGSDVIAVNATVSKRYATSPLTTWMLLVNYSNNRSLFSNIPLPGFAYTFTNEEKSSGGAVGIPFINYWWRPTPKFFGMIFALFPSVARGQIGYMIWGPIQVFAKFEYGQAVFMRKGRADSRERIYYDSKKATAGAKLFLGKGTFVELEAGRSFDRTMFDGHGSYQPTSDKLSLPSEWLAAANLQASF